MNMKKNVRDGVILVAGISLLFYQTVIRHDPGLVMLLLGMGLIVLPSSLFVERMLNGR